MIWRYAVPGTPDTLNRMISPGKGRFQAVRDQAEYWAEGVWLAARTSGRPREPLRKAHVELAYWFPDNHRRDPDNYAGKHILDGLRKAGVLADDTFEVVELAIKKAGVDPENPRVEITVRDCRRRGSREGV
ncbi:MAG TPA: RusA family crossover junction endodeoxyribonuclease, partial [Firmicutes bacterium]|nr:RusA family crossover junction endodeoxyribonuclease [Bacillota bacterium]